MERLSYLISKLRKMDWWNEVQEEYLSDIVSKSGRIAPSQRRQFINTADSIDLSRDKQSF